MLKTINDYIPKLKEKFPSLSETELRRIVSFGFRIYYYVTKRGGDILIKSDNSKEEKIIAMNGDLRWDSLKHYIHGLHKWRIKERILYSFRNTEWNGYYYFGVMDEYHDILLNQLNNNRIKFIKLDHVFCYKAPKEIYHDHSRDHIYRLKYPVDVGYKIYFKKFREKKTEIEYVGINTESTWYRNLQTPSLMD